MADFKETYKYSKDLNILYVEDDVEMLAATQIMFENFFFKVDTATDGVEGLQKYKDYKEKSSQYYDLIMTDINMPNKNGLEMIKDIRAINSEQPIIVISAYNDSERLMDLIREGISNFITKPIMPNQLIQIIHKVSQSIYSQKLQNEFIIGQSKLASMGEMIDTIAHQWQAPITIIKLQAQMLEMDINQGMLNEDDILECIDKQSIQINHIIETLNEFRLFFRPSTELVTVLCKELVDSMLILLKDKLVKHTISVDVNMAENLKIEVIPNEFKHVLINIIDNAIDEFQRADIQDPKIVINSYEEDNHSILEIIDNAGGIPPEIIDKILEANFTTKESDKGTGMGLHLVSLILQKINAKIHIENVQDGAKFSIKLR